MARHRLVKWVGDPLLIEPDGFGIPDWHYENTRVIVIPTYNGTAGTERLLKKRDGFTRTYMWEIDTPDMTIRMLEEDWQLLHSRHPHEFKDVTNHEKPESVKHDVYVVPAKGTDFTRPGILLPPGRQYAKPTIGAGTRGGDTP